METTQVELKQVAAVSTNAADNASQQLVELQLLLAGGGLGEVSFI